MMLCRDFSKFILVHILLLLASSILFSCCENKLKTSRDIGKGGFLFLSYLERLG